MKEEVDLNTYTPACLASASFDDDANGKTFTAAGWGFLDNALTKSPEIPHEAQLTGKECTDPKRKDRTICTDPVTGTGTLEVRINVLVFGREIMYDVGYFNIPYPYQHTRYDIVEITTLITGRQWGTPHLQEK